MGHIEPEMIIEDIMICLETGRCPQCNGVLDLSEDEFGDLQMRCPACKVHWTFGENI